MHRAHFFQIKIRPKKAGHFKWEAGKLDGAKKARVWRGIEMGGGVLCKVVGLTPPDIGPQLLIN